MKKKAEKLQRALTLKDLVVYGISFMTPIAPAYIYGIVTPLTGGALAVSYVLALVAILFTASSYGKMADVFPLAGATYSYVQKGSRYSLGFLAGWAIYLEYILAPPFMFGVAGLYANTVIPQIPVFVWVIFLAATATIINCLGIKLLARVNLLIVALVGAIVLLFLILCAKALLAGEGEGTLLSTKPFFNSSLSQRGLLATGGAIACFSFLGFESVTTMSEEALRPKKDIGRAIFISCLLCGVIFILQAYMAQLLQPNYDTAQNEKTALFVVVQLAGGTVMTGLYTFAVILSAITVGIAGQSSAARIMFSMGRDQMLPPKWFAYLHPKRKTPVLNLLLLCGISVGATLTLDLHLTIHLVDFGALFAFLCVNLSVIVHFYFRKREKSVLHYLILPEIGFIICAYLCFHLAPTALLVGILWLTCGVVYLGCVRRKFKGNPEMYGEREGEPRERL